MSEIQLITSGDGSTTLYLPGIDETYHSRRGAINESLHVFISAGLNFLLPVFERIHILEVGFGTGLNCALTRQHLNGRHNEMRYHALEPFPLTNEILSQLNHSEMLNAAAEWDEIHHAPWEMEVRLSNNFFLTKHKTGLGAFTSPVKFDLIYFDAFAPLKQPEVWSLENFIKLSALTNDGGVLVSYCASGQFKRNLRLAGFQVESLPGPPGKREMTRATKI